MFAQRSIRCEMPSDLSRETRSQHQHAQNGVNIILTSIISNVPDAQQDFASKVYIRGRAQIAKG